MEGPAAPIAQASLIPSAAVVVATSPVSGRLHLRARPGEVFNARHQLGTLVHS